MKLALVSDGVEEVGVTVGVLVGVFVLVGVGVAVGVRVGVCVAVGVEVGVEVLVGVLVASGVFVRVGVREGVAVPVEFVLACWKDRVIGIADGLLAVRYPIKASCFIKFFICRIRHDPLRLIYTQPLNVI